MHLYIYVVADKDQRSDQVSDEEKTHNCWSGGEAITGESVSSLKSCTETQQREREREREFC